MNFPQVLQPYVDVFKISLFSNWRVFHEFETIEGRAFSNKEQQKHTKYIQCGLIK